MQPLHLQSLHLHLRLQSLYLRPLHLPLQSRTAHAPTTCMAQSNSRSSHWRDYLDVLFYPCHSPTILPSASPHNITLTGATILIACGPTYHIVSAPVQQVEVVVIHQLWRVQDLVLQGRQCTGHN